MTTVRLGNEISLCLEYCHLEHDSTFSGAGGIQLALAEGFLRLFLDHTA